MLHTFDNDTAEIIKTAAAGAIVQIADNFLLSAYPHKSRASGGYQYGAKRRGRTWLVTETGRYAGWIKNFQSGENLDAIGFVRNQTGASYPEALRWLAGYLGISVEKAEESDKEQIKALRAKRKREEAERRAKTEIEVRLTETENKRRARSVIGNAGPIAGTVAETYLTQYRAIPRPAHDWPLCLRWHQKGRYLLACLSNDAGEFLTAQRIYLNAQTGKRQDRPKALLRGSKDGLYMRLPALKTCTLGQYQKEPLILAEGPETALSLWSSVGCEVWAYIGAGARVTVPGSRLVILARDDDTAGSPAYAATERLRESLKGQGHTVLNAWPWAERRGDKSDFNDTLKAEGADGVRERVQDALSALPSPLPGVGTARATLNNLLRGWLEKNIDRDDAPSYLLPVGVGIGKTTAAIQEAIRLYNPEKGPIIFSAPDHSLAEQTRGDIQEAAPSLSVRTWKGRDRAGMCDNLEAVNIVQDAGLSVMANVCKKAGRCPFAGSCQYLKQAEEKADIWVIPHALLFLPKPEAIAQPSLIFIDENFREAGLRGMGAKAARPLSSILLPAKYNSTHKGFTAQEVNTRAIRVVGAMERVARRGGGYLTHEDITAYDFDTKLIDYAIGQTRDAANWLANEAKDLASIEEWGASLRKLGRLCAILTEFKRVLTEGMELTPLLRVIPAKDANSQPHYRLTGTRSIKEGWHAPTVLLDATANLTSVKAFYPKVEAAPQVQADAPHARFIYSRGHGWGKISQVQAIKRHRSGDMTTRGASLEKMRLNIWQRAIETGGKSLTIANKEAIESLEKTDLPKGAGFCHFGKLAGINSFKDVSSLDIYGRPLPSVQALEMMAEAMTGHTLTAYAERLERVETTRLMRDGQEVTTARYSHPDPVANELLSEITEGQLIQAAGRARAVLRGQDTSVVIRFHSDTYPADLPLDQLEEQAPPTPASLMLASRKVLSPILLSPLDAARAYPELWSSYKAARRHFEKQKPQIYGRYSSNVSDAPKPFYIHNKENRGIEHIEAIDSRKQPILSLVRVEYRPKSAHSWRVAWVASQDLGKLKSWIERAICERVAISKTATAAMAAQATRSALELLNRTGQLHPHIDGIRAITEHLKKADHESREKMFCSFMAACAFEACHACTGSDEKWESLITKENKQALLNLAPWLTKTGKTTGGIEYLAQRMTPPTPPEIRRNGERMDAA